MREKDKTGRAVDTIIEILIIACIVTITYCGTKIVQTLYERGKAWSEYHGMIGEYVSDDAPMKAVDPEKVDEINVEVTVADRNYQEELMSAYKPSSINHKAMEAVNSDYIGWISYPSCKIQYPVAKEDKKHINKYMKTTFAGLKNPSGCLFVPYDSTPDCGAYNNFIYGHNMANGTMFGSLKFLFQKKDFSRDPYFTISFKDGTDKMYRVITAYTVEEKSEMYSVPKNKEEYRKYVKKAISRNKIVSPVPLTDAEQQAVDDCKPIVTLSTCFGAAGTTKRTLVQGVEIASVQLKQTQQKK